MLCYGTLPSSQSPLLWLFNGGPVAMIQRMRTMIRMKVGDNVASDTADIDRGDGGIRH